MLVEENGVSHLSELAQRSTFAGNKLFYFSCFSWEIKKKLTVCNTLLWICWEKNTQQWSTASIKTFFVVVVCFTALSAGFLKQLLTTPWRKQQQNKNNQCLQKLISLQLKTKSMSYLYVLKEFTSTNSMMVWDVAQSCIKVFSQGCLLNCTEGEGTNGVFRYVRKKLKTRTQTASVKKRAL